LLLALLLLSSSCRAAPEGGLPPAGGGEKTVDVEEVQEEVVTLGEDAVDVEAAVEVVEEEGPRQDAVENKGTKTGINEAIRKGQIDPKSRRIIPILYRLQKRYRGLEPSERVKILDQAEGFQEDFRKSLDQLEKYPHIKHRLDIPFLREILGVTSSTPGETHQHTTVGDNPFDQFTTPKAGGDEITATGQHDHQHKEDRVEEEEEYEDVSPLARMASPTIGRTVEELPAMVPEEEYPPWDDSWLEHPLAVASDPSPSTSNIFDLFGAVEFQYNFGLQVPPPSYPQDNSYDEVEIEFNFAPFPFPPFPMAPMTPVTFPLLQPPLAPFPQNPLNSYRPRFYPSPLMTNPRFPPARSLRPSLLQRSFAPQLVDSYPSPVYNQLDQVIHHINDRDEEDDVSPVSFVPPSSSYYPEEDDVSPVSFVPPSLSYYPEPPVNYYPSYQLSSILNLDDDRNFDDFPSRSSIPLHPSYYPTSPQLGGTHQSLIPPPVKYHPSYHPPSTIHLDDDMNEDDAWIPRHHNEYPHHHHYDHDEHPPPHNSQDFDNPDSTPIIYH